MFCFDIAERWLINNMGWKKSLYYMPSFVWCEKGIKGESFSECQAFWVENRINKHFFYIMTKIFIFNTFLFKVFILFYTHFLLTQ